MRVPISLLTSLLAIPVMTLPFCLLSVSAKEPSEAITTGKNEQLAGYLICYHSFLELFYF